MDSTLDDAQHAYRESLRQFFRSKWPESSVRASMEARTEEEARVWRQLAQQLGVAGLTLPEEVGGSGSTQIEATLVLEEMGRALYGGPYLATVVLAANALVLSGDGTAGKEYLPAIAAGEITATLAFAGGGRDRFGAPAPVARRIADGWAVSGTADRVVDGASADLVLVEADTDAGRSLFALRSEDGLARRQVETMDQTRRLARLEMTGVRARLVGAEGGAADVLGGVRTLAALALAAEAVGGAARCVQETVDYAKVRHQFGRPIGSFQAVKHRCAEMQTRLESATAAVRHGARVAAEGGEDLALLASVVKVHATESYFRTAADAIQIFGGIGFTWEHFAHLHFKRAKSSELMFGSPRDHRRAIADAVLPGPPQGASGSALPG
ncbi:acyl-CoA dehydrogenase family protein [Actinomadura viridis]|uniref:Alkylation response protein AidB-like acyl-CoA dehydrogenase n=1 Tax=Actinomadura viridis TaxID=58110 RepID=A0A931DSK3_9ACTN|nr:acyl-CoA dehydrogenase family protein [Actinomadura viridis]MBG6093071.1 alkylation response protein AidB-like acyl-CoA dehydrogenase [Actinomadura viridis]